MEKNAFSLQMSSVQILNNKDGGACVAFARTIDGFIAKTMFCKSKAYLSCQNIIKDETDETDKV